VTSRLASLLVQEGLVGAKQMADAFQRQVIYGGSLDTILLEMNAIAENVLIGALSRSSALPAGGAPNIDKLSSARAIDWFPAALAEKYRAVPLSVDGTTVRVLTTDPPDRRALDELGLHIGRAVEATIAPEHRFVHALAMVYDTPVPARFQSLQARLLRRAQGAGAAAAPTPAAAKPITGATPAVTRPISDSRPVVTDLPTMVAREPAAPSHARDHEETPRLTTRDAAAPAPIAREAAAREATAAATPASTPTASTPPAQIIDIEPLPIAQAVKMIDEATDRDEIFATLCRGARSQARYVALFMVQGDTMLGRLALADAWVDRATLGGLSLSLEAASPFRTAATGRAALLGKVGEDEDSAALLRALGRNVPTQAALLPIVLRERTVALLYADANGRALPNAALGELSNATGAAARAFQRLILAAKGRDYKAAAAQPGAKVDAAALPTDGAAAAAWRAAGDATGGRLQPTSPDADVTARHVAPAGGDANTWFLSVERGDEHAAASADRLIALGAHGAELAVARLPGPLRIDRASYRGLTPPLAEHGPLLALVARFGDLALPALERRLGESNADVRYYATLALGEIGRGQKLPLVGERLFDSDAVVRRVAVDVLHRLPESDARRAIIESLRGELPGPELPRQRMAADALGALGDAPSVPRLIELVKHDDVGLHTAARRALVAITKQDFGNSRWRWRGWWDRHKNVPRPEWLFEGLAHAQEEIRASSAEELRRMSPEHFGYHWDAPKREREESRRRWLEWYRARR
jgi:hypothetical protein